MDLAAWATAPPNLLLCSLPRGKDQEWEEERPFSVFYDMPAMLEGYRTLSRLSGGSRTEVIAGHDAAVMDMFPAPAKEHKNVYVSLHEATLR